MRKNYLLSTDSDLSQVANTARTQLEQTARQQLQSQLASGENSQAPTASSDLPQIIQAGPQGVVCASR